MPRPRKKRTRDLPLNLYKTGNGYYRYRHPQTRRWHGMGKNRREAVAGAHKLNSELLPNTLHVDRIIKPRQTFGRFIDNWQEKDMPHMKCSAATLRDYQYKLRHIRKAFEHQPTHAIDVACCAAFLDQYPPKQSNNYRALLIVLFKHAIAKGLLSTNPAEATLKKIVEVKRQRLTLQQFQAIQKHAPNWLQNAMDLGLYTLQRREDLASLTWANIHDGAIWVQQQKVEKWGTGNLKIAITTDIQAVLDRCNDSIKSDYVIHRQPLRRIKAKGRKDFTAILPELITKEFTKARDASNTFPADTDRKTLPSFHEIRSLGAKKYEDEGVPKAVIQNLLGHTSEKMTDIYLDRHEVQWVEIDI